MNSNRFQMAVYKEIRSRGIRAKDLTDADFQRIALSIRSGVEIVRDGAKVAVSAVAIRMGRRVPLPVYQARRAECLSQKCGRAGVSREGNPVCMVCGCSGAMMDAALWDAAQTCRLPPGKRRWDAYVADNP